jgi:predicted esterase YcpF (UPF0227 family)
VIVYLHGFNGGPQSTKAQVLRRYLEARGLGARFACPQLPHHPDAAIALVESEIARHPPGAVTLVGSSLGGFYATHLAERHAVRAVLLNPAVKPQRDLESYLGTQRDLHTGAEYELTREHIEAWRRLDTPAVHPERYLLLVETGDELLDYREAVAKYAGCRQVVVEGGDHSLASFPEHLPLILEFAGLV